MRRTNLPTRPCRKTYGRHRDSKRTRLIHRPCGDIAPPVGGIHVSPVVLRHECALTAQSRRSFSPVMPPQREQIIAPEARDKGLLGVTLRYLYEVRKEEEYFDDRLVIRIGALAQPMPQLQ